MIATLVEAGLTSYYGMAALFRLSEPHNSCDHLVVNIMVGAGCADCVHTCEVFATDETGTVVGPSMEAIWKSNDASVSYEMVLSALGYTLEVSTND